MTSSEIAVGLIISWCPRIDIIILIEFLQHTLLTKVQLAFPFQLLLASFFRISFFDHRNYSNNYFTACFNQIAFKNHEVKDNRKRRSARDRASSSIYHEISVRHKVGCHPWLPNWPTSWLYFYDHTPSLNGIVKITFTVLREGNLKVFYIYCFSPA